MILLALLVQAQVILNVPLARQGIFYSHHQQLVSTLVQLDMVETLQLKLVYNAIFLVQVVLEQEIINVSLANQGIFCSHHLQYAWALVLQLDTGRTLQIIFAQIATLLAQFVQVQVILNVLPANQATFYSQHLMIQLARALAQLDIGRILITTFVLLAMLLVQPVRVAPVHNALHANQGIFCNHRQ